MLRSDASHSCDQIFHFPVPLEPNDAGGYEDCTSMRNDDGKFLSYLAHAIDFFSKFSMFHRTNFSCKILYQTLLFHLISGKWNDEQW